MSEPTAQDIYDEIQRTMGFVPPLLAAAGTDVQVLGSLWMHARAGYLQNPLPVLFKDQFLTLYARSGQTPYALVLRSCVLYGHGMPTDQIVDLLRAKMPRQAEVAERIRIEAASWPYKSGWSSMPAGLERCVLWAGLRVALRRDPGGRCRNVLRETLGEAFYNNLVILGGSAATLRLWIDSHPELIPAEDPRVLKNRERLLAEAPELEELWARAGHRARRRGGGAFRRNQKLVREIARQDRIRQALRESERRFRRVVQNVPFPVMVYAQDGQIVMLNRAWIQQSGWTVRETPTVQRWLEAAEGAVEVWEPTDIEALYGWHEVIEEGEVKIKTRSGQGRTWDFYSASLGRLPDGRQAVMRVAVDVTERTQLETALWETNRRVISIVEAVTDGFIALDHEMRFQYVNGRARDMLKLNRTEVMGRQLLEVYPAAAGSELHAAILRCLRDRTTEHLDHDSETGGTCFEVHLYPSEEGLSGFIRDISERKRMERQLQESERKFRGLYESNMIGVMFASRFTGAIFECNDALLQITGYSRADLEAGRMSWITLTAPEHRAADSAAVEAVGKGPLVPYEKDYLHKLGHRVPILVGGAPVIPDGEVVMAFVIDRTAEKNALRRSEEARRLFDAIVRASPMAIILLDEQANVTLWNPAAEQLFGWREAEILGKPYPLPVPEDWPRFKQSLCGVLNGEPISDLRREAMTRDHGRRRIRLNACPVRDPDGRVLAAMAMIIPDPDGGKWTDADPAI